MSRSDSRIRHGPPAIRHDDARAEIEIEAQSVRAGLGRQLGGEREMRLRRRLRRPRRCGCGRRRRGRIRRDGGGRRRIRQRIRPGRRNRRALCDRRYQGHGCLCRIAFLARPSKRTRQRPLHGFPAKNPIPWLAPELLSLSVDHVKSNGALSIDRQVVEKRPPTRVAVCDRDHIAGRAVQATRREPKNGGPSRCCSRVSGFVLAFRASLVGGRRERRRRNPMDERRSPKTWREARDR